MLVVWFLLWFLVGTALGFAVAYALEYKMGPKHDPLRLEADLGMDGNDIVATNCEQLGVDDAFRLSLLRAMCQLTDMTDNPGDNLTEFLSQHFQAESTRGGRDNPVVEARAGDAFRIIAFYTARYHITVNRLGVAVAYIPSRGVFRMDDVPFDRDNTYYFKLLESLDGDEETQEAPLVPRC
jgi:hypothetical protein